MRYILLVALLAASAPAAARTLDVGPGQPFARPSAAIAAAADGDTVRIAPGQYVDCASVLRNDLTIEGTGPGVVLTDKTCAGKGLLVISGRNVTIRNLTLQRARVPDRNGAGIRAEGGDLTVENTIFLDNENGILAGENQTATIRVTGSTFIGNGSCVAACAHGIYAGAVRLLRVERSRFRNTHAGHHIKSRALRTEVIDCDIADGPDGDSSYLIEAPNGGSVLVERTRLEKGPHSQNPANAIVIGAEGVRHPTEELLFHGNTFVNDQARPTTFVRNMTATPAHLIGNSLPDHVRALDGLGSVR